MGAVDFVDDIPPFWASRAPDSDAFRFIDDGLSYEALENGVVALARALAAAGVARGDRVAIYLDKSLDCAVAVYAIMRAGAAYVPLDPGAPRDRLAGIISACDIAVAVTSRQRAGALAGIAQAVGRNIVALEAGGAFLAGAPTAAATPPAREDRAPDDLAYVIFTSGSTGVPKGIMHSHRTALAYASMSAALYELTPRDRLGNHSPLHFDMSTFDFYSGPLAGACTVILSEMHNKLPASLAALIEAERLTVWYSVPHAIVQLHDRGGLAARDLSALRLVIFGGEPMHSHQVQSFAAHTPNARFSNCYGPAEVNQCTVWTFHADELDAARPIPLGHATDHARLRIDGDHPEDSEGELLVATPAMMLGYWNDPDRTAQSVRRIVDPDGVARRYYATGDIVRRDGDGHLYFVGRADRQVKVRGYRVELDEVEAALTRHPDVSEAAAIAAGDPREVVAHVTAATGVAPSEEEIRGFVARALPAYAVPARITIRPDFPRTGTGKIDRKRLEEVDDG